MIRQHLASFVRESSPEQVRAWDDSIPPLQREVSEVLATNRDAGKFSTILEYEMPLELRRSDVVLLVKGGVVVLELKGKLDAAQADLDQAAAYARDLRCYHRDCAESTVTAVVVPTRARGYLGKIGEVHVAGPDALDSLILGLSSDSGTCIDRERFLDQDAYCPLPTLVEAARELFVSGTVRKIWRAGADTDDAVRRIAEIATDAARTKSRKLVLLTGVPGAGKTLVGLRTVHAHYLDQLAVPRAGGKPTVPAVFLSGNGPLVQVLQYELRGAGGDGKTFVRDVKAYVRRYSGRRDAVPPEHVLVFDEAQRAFDKEQVAEKHEGFPGFTPGQSEADHFVEFASRIPEWCVVVGLVGSGQEIHVGEEGGVVQWRSAVEALSTRDDWTIHVPPSIATQFEGGPVTVRPESCLNLDTAIRFHLAEDLHDYVAQLLLGRDTNNNAAAADRLESAGYHLRLTRRLEVAKEYLGLRYREYPEARFGLLASSKDRDLWAFGVPNDYQSTKRVKYGEWYGDSEDDYRRLSCRHLDICVTEFGAQGLELDAALVAWGTDLAWTDGGWSNANARGYRKKGRVKSPLQLRMNAYRVLLTRAREASVVFVPPLPTLDSTFEYLTRSGFKELA